MIIDKLNKLIEKIPYELDDCFYITINTKDMLELQKEFDKLNGIYIENVNNFYDNKTPTFKDFIVITHKGSHEPILNVIPEKVMKVYLYEKNKLESFLGELEKLCKKFNCNLMGCGCCGSPYINNYYTIGVENINFKDNKLIYEFYELEKYKKFIKR